MPPHLLPETFSTPANCAARRRSIRQGSQSFYLASLLLPLAVREPAYAIYAFCRLADDLIDREQGGAAAVAELERMLDRIYAGRPRQSFVERGFADVVARFAIPRAVPDALIEGLAWDAAGRRYASLDELKAYAVRVAGTVGFMMTLAMGRRDPHVLARACDLGVAMQLTNIARDVGEDAGNGRIYLPLDWLADAGIESGAWMASPKPMPEIRRVVARLLDEAETLYGRAQSGVAALPPGSRLGIDTARLLYREIGQEILRGIDPVTTRAVTSRSRKLRLVARAIVARPFATSDLFHPCIPQGAFLVDAVLRAPTGRVETPAPRWWDLKARSIRMIDLLNAFSARNAGRKAGDDQVATLRGGVAFPAPDR
jgi:phytoene synthase